LAGPKVVSGLNLKKVTNLAQQNPFVVSMIEPFKTEMAKRGGQILIVHKEPPRPVA
jgi:branched-chain amino acid transport system substrate-binding protein